jgi:anti-sigma regulatory factor (Ser/Thr protein kinase)
MSTGTDTVARLGSAAQVAGGESPSLTATSGTVPAPLALPPGTDPAQRWALWRHLELAALPVAVPFARSQVGEVLAEWGLAGMRETVQIVVSEIVTNAVRACDGLDGQRPAAPGEVPVVRLWLATDHASVLAAVWDASPRRPRRRELGLDAESGRGLLLVDALSAAWGSFAPDGDPGKVVWALCES